MSPKEKEAIDEAIEDCRTRGDLACLEVDVMALVAKKFKNLSTTAIDYLVERTVKLRTEGYKKLTNGDFTKHYSSKESP